jgi:alkylated DNA repair dioxygenase AlkB
MRSRPSETNQQLVLWDGSLEQPIAMPETMQEPAKPNCQALLLPDADIVVYHRLCSQVESDCLFADLYKNINWKQEHLKLYGKPIPIPRLTAWYGDSGKSYTYSKIAMEPESWTPTLQQIKSGVEAIATVKFNSVLLNLYRSGKDSVAWHSDDEAELGQNPVIASVSFGGTRRFMLKHKHEKDLKTEIELTHGSCLIMQGTTQHFWLHQIPKTAKPVEPRINLTFRVIF